MQVKEALVSSREAFDQSTLIRVWYDHMWNNWDHSWIPKILNADISFRGTFGSQHYGYTGVAEYMDGVQATFPDFYCHIEEMVSEGNKSFVKLSFTGTHHGTLFGIQPTMRKVYYEGAALFTFEDERIMEVWAVGDTSNLIAQLQE